MRPTAQSVADARPESRQGAESSRSTLCRRWNPAVVVEKDLRRIVVESLQGTPEQGMDVNTCDHVKCVMMFC